MDFQLQRDPGFGVRNRRGLVVSVGLHLLVVAVFVLNPDFLKSAPRRVIRIAGEDFERDRFEILELILPPELMAPSSPEPPAPEPPAVEGPAVELPPGLEAAPPPIPPPPVPPPPAAPILGPDDVIADGARPDAPPGPPEEDEEAPEVAEDDAVTGGDDTAEELAVTEIGDDPEALESDGTEGDPAEGQDGPEGDAAELEGESGPSGPSSELPPLVGENTNPNSLTLPDIRSRAENLINEAIDEERRRMGVGGRVGSGDRGDQPPNLSANATEILSDTRGYDFGPYLNQVINRVRRNWYSLIPEVARLGARGRVVLTFTIVSSGRVEGLAIQARSGTDALDKAAEGAILLSNPFSRIPADFEGDHLTLQFAFLYNWDR